MSDPSSSGIPTAPAGNDLSKMGGLNVDKVSSIPIISKIDFQKDLNPVPDPPKVEPSKKIIIGDEKVSRISFFLNVSHCRRPLMRATARWRK